MSSADPPSSPTGVGLGYAIAIAVTILVFISTVMLLSYACIRVKSNRPPLPPPPPSPSADNVVVLVLGLDGSIIDSYPKLVLGGSRPLPAPYDGPCSICLSDFQPYDSVRSIPHCRHSFHSDCIDEWLRTSATCPLCRNSPAPTPLSVSTPLSEFLPLASNAR